MDVSSTKFQEVVDDQAKLFAQLSEQKEALSKMQKAIGDHTDESGAELKQTINKMVEDVAKNVDELNGARTKMQERLDNFEKEYQSKVKWTASESEPMAKSFLTGFSNRINNTSESASVVTPTVEEIQQYGKANTGFTITVDGDPRDMLTPARKALITSQSGVDGGAGPLQVPEYQERIEPPGQQMVTVLDYLPTSTTNRSEVHWRQEVLSERTNGFGIQSIDFTGEGQGNALGESDFRFQDFSARTRTFGHHADIALQILQDQAQLQAYIEGQMMYMVRYGLENKIFYDDGTGMTWSGINASASSYDTNLVSNLNVASPQKYDILRLIKLQGDKTFFPTTLYVLNNDDCASLELTKDNNGNYMFSKDKVMRPWGVPAVKSYQFTAGSFFGLCLPQIDLVIRKGWEMGVSFENRANFEELKATLRIYGRYALLLHRPNSNTKGTFADAVR